MFNIHGGNTKYDNLNRLNKVTDSHGNATNYLYDAVGRSVNLLLTLPDYVPKSEWTKWTR